MGRKELRAMVLEEYPKAVCREAYEGVGFVVFSSPPCWNDSEEIGYGATKKAAWCEAAELVTAS